MHDRYPLRTFTANLQCVERAERAGTQGDDAQKTTMKTSNISSVRAHVPRI